MKRYHGLLIIFVLLNSLLLFGCNEDDNNGSASDDNVSPEIIRNPDIILDPNNNTPLAALLTLETNEPTKVSVQVDVFNNVSRTTVTGDDNSFTVEFDEFNTSHELPILGLKPDSTHTLNVAVIDNSGNSTVSTELLEVTTDPLPANFPPIEVESDPSGMEPGITLFPIGGRGENSDFGNAIIAVNDEGEVVWYYKINTFALSDVRRLANGNLVYLEGRNSVVEINMLGEVINIWYAENLTIVPGPSIGIDANALHHEVFEMDNGNLLSLDVELREINNFPTSAFDMNAPGETAIVAGDVVVEFTRDGEIVNRWSFLDMLDPRRIAYGSLGGFWDFLFNEPGGTRDWSHANSVVHDPYDNSIIVSLRHQDAVVKFSRETGELIWILGPHANWNQDVFGEYLLEPVGGNFLWQYHQHAPMVTSNGNILLFDNGNFRASAFEERLPAMDNFSRAVEYRINEETMQVEQVWEYGQFLQEPLYAPFISDADELRQTGNILVTFGGIAKNEMNEPTNAVAGSKISVRIQEVTHTEEPEVVFDLSIDSGDTLGWQVYRSERLSGLYP